MVRVDLKGIHRMKKRLASGALVEYHYAYRGGPLIWKTGHPYAIGSRDYVAAFRDAANTSKAAGLFREVIREFQSSAEWKKLAPRTKTDYSRWLNRIDEKFGEAPIGAFNLPGIKRVALKWRDQWSGKQADYAWTVLVRLVSWAKKRTILSAHHLEGVERVYSVDRSDIIFTTSDIDAMHIAPLAIRRAIGAATETGLRPGDLVELARSHVEPTPMGRRIRMRTKKRKRVVSIPVTPRMGEIIDQTPPGQMLILMSPRGKQWGEEHLSKSVKEWVRKAGLDERLRFYDARGTACTRLLLAGASLSEIALVMGWSIETTAAMIQVYASLDPQATDSVLVKLSDARAKAQSVERAVE